MALLLAVHSHLAVAVRNAQALAGARMTGVTIPTLAWFLPLVLVVCIAWAYLCWRVLTAMMNRYVGPWMKRRLGLPEDYEPEE